MSQPIIHWFRRDLRLSDNTALHAACATGKPIIPLFVLDTTLLNSEMIGTPRLQFLLNALHSLDASLRELGTQLLVQHGDPLEVLRQLVRDVDAAALHYNIDYSPYARRRDDAISESLDIAIHAHHDAVLLPPGTILKKDGDPYTVYTYYWKKWKAHEKPAVLKDNIAQARFFDLGNFQNDAIPSIEALGHKSITIDLPPADEVSAQESLAAFVKLDINRYDEQRDWLPINPFAGQRPAGTSYLSPYLRLGLLSPRQARAAAVDAYNNVRSDAFKNSIETWVSELAWREFYVQILHYFPHVTKRDFVDTYLELEWRDAPHELNAWKNGQTGYPIVDAPMRQLKAIGWMPNRARMIVASFLTKDLLIHWQHGEKHFMQLLLDGDPAANNGGWQWAAGTGTDAQPYFRIFNPISQSKKYAKPEYLRHWLPELKDVPDKHIHEPWKMKNPPRDYPTPIVDHKMARERTLAAFKAARAEKA